MVAVSEELKTGMTLMIQSGLQTWRTRVERIEDDDVVLDAGSLLPDELTELEPASRLTCRFHLSHSVCSFESSFLGIEEGEEQDWVRIQAPRSISQHQRRQHPRAARRMPIKMRLPLFNRPLSRSRDRDYIFICWVEGTALNISAGGFKAELNLPRGHKISPHDVAEITLELDGLKLNRRSVRWLRIDWSTDEPLQVYTFEDLEQAEIDVINQNNQHWLSFGSRS